jgi:hypothetical protein
MHVLEAVFDSGILEFQHLLQSLPIGILAFKLEHEQLLHNTDQLLEFANP